MTETRVAVVDDDQSVRELLEVILTDEGYTPIDLAPGSDLLARLRVARPSTIVLDWRVEGVEGHALDAIRADPALARVPLLICTGDLDAMREHAPRLATQPNVVIVEKPFQIDVLLSVLERISVTDSGGTADDGPPPLHADLAAAIARRGAAAQARAVLAVFRAAADWPCAELWLQDRGLLRCVAAVADQRRRGFAETSRTTSLVPGFGLPGRVVVSRRPAWIPDVLEDRNFPRAAAARRFGVRAAAGVPIVLAKSVLGMVGLYGSDPASLDEELLAALASRAAGLGAWLDGVRGTLLRPDAISAAARRLAQDATTSAEVAAVDLVDRTGGLQRVAVAHRDPAMADVAMRLEAFSPVAEGPVAVAVRTGQPQRMTLSDATLRRWSNSPEHLLVLRALQLRSVVAAPLLHRGTVIGGVTLSSPDPRWHASPAAAAALATIDASPACDELGRLVAGRRRRSRA